MKITLTHDVRHIYRHPFNALFESNINNFLKFLPLLHRLSKRHRTRFKDVKIMHRFSLLILSLFKF